MKTIKTGDSLNIKHDDVKVNVTYRDDKNAHETTIKELKERFKQENLIWRTRFISSLLNDGEAWTNFGGYYTLIN